jgi:uncharacterized protein YuzE
MKITYDDVADVVGFELSPTPAQHTLEQGNGVLIGYDDGNHVVSVQVLDASKQFDNETLALLRSPATPLSLAEAAKESGPRPPCNGAPRPARCACCSTADD